MSNPTFFIQVCPTCGRRLQVLVELLGTQVVCQHCFGRFEAFDGDANPPALTTQRQLIDRVEKLLASMDPSETLQHQRPSSDRFFV